MKNTRQIVALSGGKDSTAMALRLKELNPDEPYEYISTPTGNEHAEVFTHLKGLERILKAPIRFLKPYAGDGLVECIRENKMIPNFRARFCTRELKIEPTISFLKSIRPAIQYVGLRADEPLRKGIYGELDDIEQCYPMRDWGWSLEDVHFYLKERGVDVPARTDCAWCFYQRLPEWKHLWKNHPKTYAKAVQIEEELGHTFRSDGRDTWPAALSELAKEFQNGRPVKGYTETYQMELFNCHLSQSCRVCSL